MGGTVNFADWSFSWSIPVLSGGGGLKISSARFRGTSVLYEATQPFVLVPYHGDSPTFKDGLNPVACGQGIGFNAMVPTAPNAPAWQITGGQAQNDNQYDPTTNPFGGVMVELEPANLIEPARAIVWVKLQAWNYQYVQLWEFRADGSIEVMVGLAGRLLPNHEPKGHIHNFYFKLDFDIVTSGNNLVQESAHLSNAPGADITHDLPLETHRTFDPATRTTWRVLNKTPKPNGQRRSYELVPGSDGSPDGTYSTADLWVVRYDPTGTQEGSQVTCKDTVLSNQYESGQGVDGQDVVVWYCLREHHPPRQVGEERRVVPYEFHGFHLQPRDFLDDTPTNLYPTSPPSPL